jgi:MFS family permease
VSEALPKVAAGRKLFFSFLLVNMLSGIVRGTTMFVVNLYAIHLGANMLELGLLRGITGFSILIAALPLGFLADQFGGRRLYLFGEISGAILNLSLLVVTTPMELIVRSGLIGLTMSFRIAAMQSTLLEQLQVIGRNKAGWLRGSNFIGMLFLGPLLGALLLKEFSYNQIFVITTIAMAAVILLAWLTLESDPRHAKIPKLRLHLSWVWHVVAQVKAMAQNRQLVGATISEGLNSACFSVFSVFVLAVALKVFSFTPQAAGRLISLGGGAFVVAVFFGGFVVENLKFHKALLGSFGATILGLGLLAMAEHGTLLWVGAVVLGAAMGITNVLTIMRVSNVRGRTGQVAGFYNVSTSLGNTVGPVAGGMVGKIFGPQAVFVLFIPLFVLCGIWMCINSTSLEVYHES